MEEKRENEVKAPPEKAKKGLLSKLNNKRIQLIIAAILGVLLIVIYISTLDFSSKSSGDNLSEYGIAVQNQLKRILSKINGVKEVDVIITFADSGETVYSVNKTMTKEIKTENGKTVEVIDDKTQVVLVGGKPLVEKVISPKVLGVVIVAKGADNAIVKMEIVNATVTALNITSDIIEVFNMN